MLSLVVLLSKQNYAIDPSDDFDQSTNYQSLFSSTVTTLGSRLICPSDSELRVAFVWECLKDMASPKTFNIKIYSDTICPTALLLKGAWRFCPNNEQLGFR
jgi:hypothetical protein